MFRENERIEFKKTTGELNEAMVSISAILNKHKAGTVYFGIKNNGTPFRFEITDSTIRDVSRKIYESIRPQIFPTVELEKIEDTDVIRVDFQGTDIPYSAYGKYYIRVADEDRELTPSELRKIMIGREYEENWESVLTYETTKDVDEKQVKLFYEKAVQCGRMPEFKFSAEGILRHFLLERDGKLTNAGRVLFSAHRPVSLKMAVFATEHKDTFLDIRKEEGNIFELIDEAVQYIVKNIRWRAQLNKDGIHRDEIPEIPLVAIREAVVNSFAHARYDIAVQHEIDIFPDKVVIVNPGSFASEYSPREYSEHNLPSSLRNETIAQVLYCSKDVETFGTGLRKIYKACNDAGVEVLYENHEMDFMLQLSRPGNNGAVNGLINGAITDNEDKVLHAITKDPTRTVAEISEITGISKRTVTRVISALKTKNLIERVGSNKTGYWKIN